MATLPFPAQVARSNLPTYESFYKQVDPAGTDHVPAMEAASFLKRSALPDGVLSKIWDFSDPEGKGFLDKRGFFVALKLIALSQSGKDPSVANLSLDVPPPKLVDTDKTISGRNSPGLDWSIKLSERKKYEEMFFSMSPVNSKLPGDKVKQVMLNSKLPVDTLGKIWDLSDTDQDGFLSKEEFILAMHLIYKALENIPVPPALPPELTAILRRKNSMTGSVHGSTDMLPSLMDSSTTGRVRRSSTPSSELTGRAQTWIVNPVDKIKYDELFHKLDTDIDGYVTGGDVKDTFLQSGLPQSVLATIWNLCDIKQNGKLNVEQFALAMHFVQQKLQGMEVPAALFPEMIPPTLRPKPVTDILTDAPLAFHGEPEMTGNKELDIIGGEIKELQSEKMSLEKDLAQKEADAKIKNGELKTCQNELEALNAMLKQLEMQKGEASKRLNDLDNQIDTLNKKVEEHNQSLGNQEDELKKKRQELGEIKVEEEKLGAEITKNKSNLDTLTTNLQNTQLQISQIKLKMDQVNEQYELMNDGILKMDSALTNGDFNRIPDFILNGISPIHEIDFNSLQSGDAVVPNDMDVPATVDGFQEDPFVNNEGFQEVNGFATDPFAHEDPFKSDPFLQKAGSLASSDDPFKSEGVATNEDPFHDPFNESFATSAQAKSDPFGGSDPFASSFPSSGRTGKDPFDPFGLSKSGEHQSPVTESANADPFGADPFGPQAVPPPRPTSPTPALPPKKSKAPPPRPAPPKIGTSATKPAPTRAAPAPPVPPAPDPFKLADAEAAKTQGFSDFYPGANATQDPFDPFGSGNRGGAADSFANFDNFSDFDMMK